MAKDIEFCGFRPFRNFSGSRVSDQRNLADLLRVSRAEWKRVISCLKYLPNLILWGVKIKKRRKELRNWDT